MKKVSVYIVLSAVLLLTVSVLGGCQMRSPDESSPSSSLEDELFAYKTQLLELENKLLTLQNEQFENELEHLSEIKKLTGEIDALRELLYAPDTPPAEENKNVYLGFLYEIENGQATIVGYEGGSLSPIIPASIDGKPVRAIGESAFSSLDITSVTIPDTVVSIGWFAFSDCSALTRAVIPKSVTAIGYEAFSGCKGVTVYAERDSYAEKYAKSYGIRLSLE